MVIDINHEKPYGDGSQSFSIRQHISLSECDIDQFPSLFQIKLSNFFFIINFQALHLNILQDNPQLSQTQSIIYYFRRPYQKGNLRKIDLLIRVNSIKRRSLIRKIRQKNQIQSCRLSKLKKLIQMQEQIECIKTIKEKFNKLHGIKENKNVLRIFYYPFAAQAQVMRLLCQYTKLPYQDVFVTPMNKKQYKKQFQNFWMKFQLPFIKNFDKDSQQDIIITGIISPCIYIIAISGREQLLGKSIADKADVDMFISSYTILQSMIATFLFCDNCNCSGEGQCKCKCKKFDKEQTWQNIYQKRFNEFESKAKEGTWYLGYLTIIDFFLHIFLHYMQFVFPDKIVNYPKLLDICSKFQQINQIKEYNKSQRCVRQMCPKRFFSDFKRYIDYMKTKCSYSCGTYCSK